MNGTDFCKTKEGENRPIRQYTPGAARPWWKGVGEPGVQQRQQLKSYGRHADAKKGVEKKQGKKGAEGEKGG